jgi:tetratricopeptide (TPR) repeat protein
LTRETQVSLLCLLLGALWLSPAPAAAQPPGSPPPAAPAGTSDAERSDEAFGKGVSLHQAGDILGAIGAYEQALRYQPSRLDAHSNLGAALAHLGRFDEAVEHYREALEVDPGQVQVWFNLGLALYKSGRAEEAAAAFRQVLDRDATQRAPLLLLADCLLQLGKDAEAVALLSPRESDLGDDKLFAYLLGTALVRQKDLARGQALIDRLFRAGESAEGHLLLGAQYVRRDDWRNALPELKRAIEMNPDLPGAHALYGMALTSSGDRPAAMAAFRQELLLNPNDFDANLRLGLLLRDENQVDAAADYVKRAARLRPNDPDVLYGLARIHLAQESPQEARKALEGLVAAVPEFENGHVLLATVYYRLGLREDGDRERAVVDRLRAERKVKEGVSPEAAAAGEPAPPTP